MMGADFLSLWWHREAHLEPENQGRLFKALTTPLSRLYSCGLRQVQQRQAAKLPGRTISIGNIAVGGTGKSPVTIAIAAYLQSKGYSPAILTRGYGSGLARTDSMVLVNATVVLGPQSGLTGVPDEARMQSAALPGVPVVVGARRHDAANRFLQEQKKLGLENTVSHWLLDDGFQHRSLARDLDLVLLDAARPFGNGWLLPRGLLREPPAALSRADIVLLTRWQSSHEPQEAKVRSVFGGPIMRSPFAMGALAAAPDQNVQGWSPSLGPSLVAAGVAYPQRFLEELKSLGVRISDAYFVGDHEHFSSKILARKCAGAASIITTAKDYWRDPEVFAKCGVPVFLQPLVAQLASEDLETILRL